MLRNRLFNILIVIALVIVAALTAREALATSIITSKTDAAIQCDSLPARNSVHTVNVKETGMRVAVTEDGPTGVEGGLKELFTAYRTCSR